MPLVASRKSEGCFSVCSESARLSITDQLYGSGGDYLKGRDVTIRKLEEISANAWPGVFVRFYGGWVMRSAGGYTNRANSVLPLYDSGESLDRKIETARGFYAAQGLETLYKVTPASSPSELDSALRDLGYVERDRARVMIKNIGTEIQDLSDLRVFRRPSRDWIDTFSVLSTRARNNEYWVWRILNSISADAFYVLLKKAGKTLGCAMGVLEEGYFGVFGVTIEENSRSKGYGCELTKKLLGIGRSAGAKWAYLQVDIVNGVAIELYESLGFEELYQYWYRGTHN